MTIHADYTTAPHAQRSAVTLFLFGLGIIVTAWTIWTAAAIAFLDKGWGHDMPDAGFIAMVVGSVALLSGAYWWSRRETSR